MKFYEVGDTVHVSFLNRIEPGVVVATPNPGSKLYRVSVKHEFLIEAEAMLVRNDEVPA